jgi:hypothetical protein
MYSHSLSPFLFSPSLLQIGGFALFEDAVSATEVAKLYECGTDLFSSFETFEHIILQQKSAFSFFKSRPKVLAFYSPLVCKNYFRLFVIYYIVNS